MKSGFALPFWLMMAVILSSAAAVAQQLPPVEPPKPMPESPTDAQTLHVTTTEVLVPTLVEKRGGGIIYGLKQGDFVVEDNGVPQKIHVQEEMDTAPVALVIAVELGGASVLEFDKLAKMGPLLDLYLTDPRSEVALMGFDSRPHLISDYTHSGDQINDALNHLDPGDGGAAILDTISSAVDLLETQPKEYRRVLLLISEQRDHGSRHTKPAALIQKIGGSDVLILSVAFSPTRAEFEHDLANDVKGNGEEEPTMSMVSALIAAIEAFKKNVTKEIALMSGGEYRTFTGDKRFEQRVVDAAKHMRNRYLITFSPSDPTSGLHTLRVRTTQDYGARIVARANYWAGGGP
ncbi:MAG TPA: VWA domain-containing protein [Terriglobales bacterium]|nr:VWA domain-containing protein [Terriglobales bacterium]